MLHNPGEVLYRFLLAQSSTPPTYYLHITGTHEETKTRTVKSHNHSYHHCKSEKTIPRPRLRLTTTEAVADFDFRIDLTSNIIKDPTHAPVHWSILDDEPAYRGDG
jgi:hypothetical protein